MKDNHLISIIVPVYNEALSLPEFYQEVTRHMQYIKHRFELIFIDDGSSDRSVSILRQLRLHDKRIRLIEFARNFGKESAVSAGLHVAKGKAAIILDADLQHPPGLIKRFIVAWEKGAEVVVGLRRYSQEEGRVKRAGSWLFYRIMDHISHTKVTPNATDYRLLDRCAIDAFNQFTERNRMARGLIDWLGFKRAYIHFNAPPRKHGVANYRFKSLVRLAINSFTAYSLLPLKLAGYIGVIILVGSGLLGLFFYAETYIVGDPYNLHISGTAMLATLLLFLVGIVLACLGLVALYIARIHEEVINRPLYVVRQKALDEEEA